MTQANPEDRIGKWSHRRITCLACRNDSLHRRPVDESTAWECGAYDDATGEWRATAHVVNLAAELIKARETAAPAQPTNGAATDATRAAEGAAGTCAEVFGGSPPAVPSGDGRCIECGHGDRSDLGIRDDGELTCDYADACLERIKRQRDDWKTRAEYFERQATDLARMHTAAEAERDQARAIAATQERELAALDNGQRRLVQERDEALAERDTAVRAKEEAERRAKAEREICEQWRNEVNVAREARWHVERALAAFVAGDQPPAAEPERVPAAAPDARVVELVAACAAVMPNLISIAAGRCPTSVRADIDRFGRALAAFDTEQG